MTNLQGEEVKSNNHNLEEQNPAVKVIKASTNL